MFATRCSESGRTSRRHSRAQVNRIDTAENDIASFAAITTDMSIERLSWYVDNTVSRELLSVPGLASVSRTGGVDREIRVILDPARLQAYGVTAAQVNQQLRSTNINTAGGRAEIGGREQALRVTGNAATAFQLGETQINVGGGRTVRLSALADVRDSFAEQRGYATRDGQQVLSLSIQRAQGYSDLTVYEGAEEKLRALEERNPGVKFELLSTNANEVEDSYKQSMTPYSRARSSPSSWSSCSCATGARPSSRPSPFHCRRSRPSSSWTCSASR
jgi:multidrug efflux pump subunit AcrB